MLVVLAHRVGSELHDHFPRYMERHNDDEIVVWAREKRRKGKIMNAGAFPEGADSRHPH